MINTYLMVALIILALLFVTKNMNKTPTVTTKKVDEYETDSVIKRTVDYPSTTTVSKVLNKIKENIPLPILTAISPEPINIIKNRGNYEPIKYNPIELDNSIISANPGKSTEYRFVDENPKKAWSDKNVSQFPKFHNSNKIGELTNTGDFFDSQLTYHDNISPKSTKNLPDRCFLDSNNKVVCDFNDRLQNIPPTLIENKENNIINMIGNEDVYNKGIYGSKTLKVSEENEKSINGGDYFKGVKGFSNDDGYLSLENIPINTNYSI